MDPNQVLDESWPALPASVPQARHAVLGHLVAAETKDPPLKDIGLAVSEAVTNAVNHAYRDREPGPIRVRVSVADDEIELMVQDHGTGMTPRTDSPGMGLGLPLLTALADRLEVRVPRRGGTRLCLWFVADRAAATLPG